LADKFTILSYNTSGVHVYIIFVHLKSKEGMTQEFVEFLVNCKNLCNSNNTKLIILGDFNFDFRDHLPEPKSTTSTPIKNLIDSFNKKDLINDLNTYHLNTYSSEKKRGILTTQFNKMIDPEKSTKDWAFHFYNRETGPYFKLAQEKNIIDYIGKPIVTKDYPFDHIPVFFTTNTQSQVYTEPPLIPVPSPPPFPPPQQQSSVRYQPPPPQLDRRRSQSLQLTIPLSPPPPQLGRPSPLYPPPPQLARPSPLYPSPPPQQLPRPRPSPLTSIEHKYLKYKLKYLNYKKSIS
jgi:hypothetical protein